MKKVLMSIHPKWCEKIFNGSKTIEVRKTAPKIDTPFEVFVYQTKHKRGKSIITEVLNSVYGGGKVIGSFVCDMVEEYTFSGYNARYRINDVDLKKTCLNHPELIAYGKGKILYGWHISDLKIYDKPKELGEFRKPCIDKYQYCQACKYGFVTLSSDEEEYAMYHGGSYDTFDTVCTNRITRPPQSWMYVEELI